LQASPGIGITSIHHEHFTVKVIKIGAKPHTGTAPDAYALIDYFID
jgi:hypothetical protein